MLKYLCILSVEFAVWKRLNVCQSQVTYAGGDNFGRNEYKHCKE